MLHLLVFDWSGTVSDDRRPVYEANMRLLREYGKPTMTFEEWLPRTKLTAAEFLIAHGINSGPTGLNRAYATYFEEAKRRGIVPVIYPGVQDTFRYLRERNKEIVVLSSHPEKSLRREAEQYGIAYLLSIISGDSTNKVQGLRDICKRFRATPDDVIYTGDTVFDVRAAKSATVHSAVVCGLDIQWGYHSREMLLREDPEFALDTIEDFINGKIPTL